MRAAAVFALAFGLCKSASALAQDLEVPEVTFPELVSQGADATAFVPAGRLLEREINGDLNADGVDDLVLVLHDSDPANLTKPDLGMDVPLDTNPRLLAVAMADAKGGYRLALANANIIPRVIYTNESDPLSESGGVSIDRGSLVVAIYYFYSSGGSDTGNMSFRFRHENHDFRLIGYDRTNVNRMSGKIETVSANFLNRKVIVKTGLISEDTGKTVTKKLKPAKVVHIPDIEDPWAFAPEY